MSVDEVLAEAAPAIAAAHGLGLLVLFGSRARGDAHERSDLDVGVERVNRRRLSLTELGSIEAALARAIPGVGVEVVDLVAADTILRLEIVRDGRLLHESTPGTFKDLVARTLIDRDDLGPWLERCVAGVGRAARRDAKR